MFSSRLRSLRMKRGYTQQRMADMLTLSLNAYQKYEQSERLPPLDTLVKLADILECPTDFLLGRDAFLCSLGVCVDEYL
jgi:transcriptional regulator with XRE-family HTH domain